MLKTILSKLNGHAVEPPSLAEALAQLGRDRETVQGELSALNQRRRQLLLNDADDKTVDRVEREIDRATVRLEKITLAEAPLREQLATATAVERKRRWDAHLSAHRTAAAEFIASARATIAAHDALVGIVEQAHREGFAAEIASTMPATPHLQGNPLCAPDLLDLFERSLFPRTVTVTSPAPRPAARAPAPQPTLQHGVSLAPQARESWTAPRAPDDSGPLEPGQVLAIVLRSGYSADGQTLSHAGRKVRLPRETAMAAARAGAIEILQESRS